MTLYAERVLKGKKLFLDSVSDIEIIAFHLDMITSVSITDMVSIL